MDELKNWEYRVKSFGNAWKSAKPEEINEELDILGAEGWEVVSSCFNPGGSIMVIAKRLLTDANKRRKTRQLYT